MHADLRERVTGTHTMRRAGHTLDVASHVTGHVAGSEGGGESLFRARVTVGEHPVTEHSRNVCEGHGAKGRESRSVQVYALSKILRVRLWRSLLLRPRRSQ
eukprot:3383832-Prymnesium_polylepis.2